MTEHAVRLYHCFSLSLRDVELILAARSVVVSHETVRDWSLRFGRLFANTLKRRRPRAADKWFMDEVFIRIGGKQHYLWRAVDQDGHVLDILVQSRRNTRAGLGFFRKLPKGLQYVAPLRVAPAARHPARLACPRASRSFMPPGSAQRPGAGPQAADHHRCHQRGGQ